MLIVSGRLYVQPERRDAFLAASLEAVKQARQTAGCLDFVVAADPIEPDRVNVFEQWESEKALTSFRGAGPSPELRGEILRAEVATHRVLASAPP
jgi:quinol monooxygenase YgiN